MGFPSSYAATLVDQVYGPRGSTSVTTDPANTYFAANSQNRYNVFYPVSPNLQPADGWKVIVAFVFEGFITSTRLTSISPTIDPVERTHWLWYFLNAGFVVVSASVTFAQQSDAFAVAVSAPQVTARGAFKSFKSTNADQFARDHFCYKDVHNLVATLREKAVTLGINTEWIYTFGVSAGADTALAGAFMPDFEGYNAGSGTSWYSSYQTRANGVIAINPQTWLPQLDFSATKPGGQLSIFPNAVDGSNRLAYDADGFPLAFSDQGAVAGAYQWDSGVTVRQFCFLNYAFRHKWYWPSPDHVKANGRQPVFWYSENAVGEPKSSVGLTAFSVSHDYDDEWLNQYTDGAQDSWTTSNNLGYPKDYGSNEHDGWHVVAGYRALMELNEPFQRANSELTLLAKAGQHGQTATFASEDPHVPLHCVEWLRKRAGLV